MKASLIVTGLLFGGVLLAEADFGQLCSDGAKAAKEKDFVTAEAKYAEAMKAAADSQQKCKAVLGKFQALRSQKNSPWKRSRMKCSSRRKQGRS